MRKLGILVLVPAVLGIAAFHSSSDQTRDADRIIALERGALDKWGKGDPDGFFEIYAPEITYFDPFQPARVDGRETMRKLYEPIRGKVNVPSYEMNAPKVQRRGDMAVLTYNLVSHGKLPNGDTVTVRWNSTSVYARSGGKWSEIHSHWSFTQPKMQQPGSP